MNTITVIEWDSDKQRAYKKKYPVIDWHYCKDELPKESGKYLVSKLGVWSTDIDEPQILYDEKFRQIEIALFVVDIGLFDTRHSKSVYAWAELPDTAKY